jgi:hypothetical protein
LTPSWTEPTPSGCPSPQTDASLGSGAEVIKRPNFIKFYEISRSLHSNKGGTIEQTIGSDIASKRKVLRYDPHLDDVSIVI